MDITKEDFMEKYRITTEQFADAQFSWNELSEIAKDYEKRRIELDRIRSKFVREYFGDKEALTGLQSYRSRCKASEHVIEKLIRKRLLEFSELLNRLSGMGDEMGSYYHRLQNVPEQNFKGKGAMVMQPQGGRLHFSNHGVLMDTSNVRTFQDAIDSVVRE